MLILILTIVSILRIISIPLIIIFGEAQHVDEKNRTIILLILSFLYNNFLGFVTWGLWIIIATSLSILSIIILGTLILSYLIVINLYIKRRVDINNTLYLILIIVAFLIGVLLK